MDRIKAAVLFDCDERQREELEAAGKDMVEFVYVPEDMSREEIRALEDHFVLMEVVPGDPVQTPIWDEYKAVLNRYEPEAKVHTMERFAYYERAKEAYCVVATGETAQYANMILKKGVVR